MKAMVLAVGLALLACGCTEQQRAKQWGGTTTINLPVGQKVVNTTWKDSDLWILTRPMRPGEARETYTLTESSSWGVFQGQVLIRERSAKAEDNQ